MIHCYLLSFTKLNSGLQHASGGKPFSCYHRIIDCFYYNQSKYMHYFKTGKHFGIFIYKVELNPDKSKRIGNGFETNIINILSRVDPKIVMKESTTNGRHYMFSDLARASFWNGLFHSYNDAYGYKKDGLYCWYRKGMKHRVNPETGLIHTDCPAVINPNGLQEYWFRDQFIIDESKIVLNDKGVFKVWVHGIEVQQQNLLPLVDPKIMRSEIVKEYKKQKEIRREQTLLFRKLNKELSKGR